MTAEKLHCTYEGEGELRRFYFVVKGDEFKYQFWKEGKPTHEVVKLDLWDALDYLAQHKVLADGPVVWRHDGPHLNTTPSGFTA